VNGLELVKSTNEIQRKEPKRLEEKEKENKTLRGGRIRRQFSHTKEIPRTDLRNAQKKGGI